MEHVKSQFEDILSRVEPGGDRKYGPEFPHPEKLWTPEQVFGKDFTNPIPEGTKRIQQDIRDNKPMHYLFTGKVGCGKTIFAQCVVHTYHTFLNSLEKPDNIQSLQGKLSWQQIKMYEHYKKHLDQMKADETNTGLSHIWVAKNLFVDDLGDEKPDTPAAREYVASVLTSRYEHILKGHARRTILTTNLTYQDLKERYGSRITDRMDETFTVFKFPNDSFRKQRRRVIEG